MALFSRAPICGATITFVVNGSFQSRFNLWRHKHVCGKWLFSVALLFVAPQTRLWEMVLFSRAPICGATNTFVGNGSFQSRFNLCRNKHVCGKWFFSVALLFVVPQTRSFERTLTLKMEAECAPEMLVSFYQDTRCHEPEESSLTYRCTSEGAFS